MHACNPSTHAPDGAPQEDQMSDGASYSKKLPCVSFLIFISHRVSVTFLTAINKQLIFHSDRPAYFIHLYTLL